jgi:hypothetical protein
MLKYCARVDAPDAARLQEKVKRLVHGASDAEVARIRSTAEYRTAYDAVTDFVSKVDEHNARQACSGSVASRK